MSQLGQSHRTNPWTDDFRSISVNRRSRRPLACRKRANTRLMHRALLGLFYHIVGAGKKGGRNVDAKARAVAELITKLNSVGCSMGRSLG